jgi:hypothetical protein
MDAEATGHAMLDSPAKKASPRLLITKMVRLYSNFWDCELVRQYRNTPHMLLVFILPGT